MPFYAYRCERCEAEFTTFYPTFTKALPHEKETACETCLHGVAQRVPSAPVGFGLYGKPDGYHKPSTTKRSSWSK